MNGVKILGQWSFCSVLKVNVSTAIRGKQQRLM
jgi:hypothetical protein